MATYNIATIEGDGIGPEVCAATVTVLKEALGSNLLSFNQFPGGASHYVKTGQVLPQETFDACNTSHAILHGAAGLPSVTYPDGTEVGNDLHLQLRFNFIIEIGYKFGDAHLHHIVRCRTGDGPREKKNNGAVHASHDRPTWAAPQRINASQWCVCAPFAGEQQRYLCESNRKRLLQAE